MASKTPRYIPEGYHTVTPYLIVRGAEQALAFYKKAFNASELYRLPMPDGRIGHAELRIGDSRVMLADEMPEMKILAPPSLGGTPVGIALYVEDCDAIFNQAVSAGAKVERPLADQFYGDRSGTLIDPFGHKWTVGTHQEDVSPEEMKTRMSQQPPT
jgi:PhnB protein